MNKYIYKVRFVTLNFFMGAVAHGRVLSQKIAQLSLNKSLADIFYTNM